ncbi:NRDE family protein [Jejuia pallidilutea]|nr:NRDE family protein [Jejuia pallidilutea]
MCTVTIVPNGETDFVLTSNRDEAPNRASIAPDFYTVENTKVLFPKDQLSDGTWIGVSEKQRVICVLNGGFKIHERKSSYRLSRGIITKHLMVAPTIVAAITTYSFDDIEPFTMVIADWNNGLKFFELVWDGNQKHLTELPLEPKIWSSSTLYNPLMRTERANWFEDYKSDNKLDASALLNFHKTAGKGNLDYGVIMNRYLVRTTSITQIEKKGNCANMHYENLLKGQQVSKTLKFPVTVNG